MKTLRVMVCGLLMFSILGCPVLAAAAPMAGEADPAAVEAMDPNVIAPDGAVVEDAAPAVPEGADQENALPPAGDQIVDAEPVAQGDLADVPVVAASGKTISAKDIVTEASNLLGYKYVWGGKSPSAGGFDCTGLIYYVYHTKLGHSITFDQLYYPKKLLAAGTKITRKADLKPGDIVQYTISHVGIYIGNNMVIHAGTTYGVSKISINSSALTFDYGIRLKNVVQDTVVIKDPPKKPAEINFSGLTAPKTLTQGSIYSLGGTITSKNSNIASVKAEVINNSTKKAAISSSDSGLNTSKYSLPKSKVDNNLKFGNLKAGTYYIKYTAKTKDGTTKTGQTGTFTVKAPATTISFSGLTAPKTLKQGSIYSLGGTITSKNSNIASVKAEVINNSTKKVAISSSDSGLNTSKYSLPKSKVDNNLKFGTLKAGTYYIKYTVKTKDNTTKTSQTATFTVKK